MTKLNPAIAGIPMPAAIARLPLDPSRGYPVPWFVTWLDGRPEFRVADGRKFQEAVKHRRCWTCGDRLDNRCTYIIGPMCAVNRTTAEPPNHPACAEYSVRACPFLSRPGMVRREGGLPEEGQISGHMIARNPGVSCLWSGRWPGATRFGDGKGGILFRLHDPLAVAWYAEGRAATPAEVWASIDSGLPLLADLAAQEGQAAIDHLDGLFARAESLFPDRPALTLPEYQP